jgi:hypothetical protein
MVSTALRIEEVRGLMFERLVVVEGIEKPDGFLEEWCEVNMRAVLGERVETVEVTELAEKIGNG